MIEDFEKRNEIPLSNEERKKLKEKYMKNIKELNFIIDDELNKINVSEWRIKDGKDKIELVKKEIQSLNSKIKELKYD